MFNEKLDLDGFFQQQDETTLYHFQAFINDGVFCSDDFRRQYLWTPKVNIMLVRNLENLEYIYRRYGIAWPVERKFTF